MCFFMMFVVVVFCVGYICVLLFRILKFRLMSSNEVVIRYFFKKGIFMMGGLYFVFIGEFVVEVIVGFSFAEIFGAVVVILVFVVIGLVDFLSFENNNSGLFGWMSILLEVKFYWWFFLKIFFVFYYLFSVNSFLNRINVKFWCCMGSCWVMVFLLVMYYKFIIFL